jgi:GDP-4-dehydro-6-deoxy-D-mannose reductase
VPQRTALEQAGDPGGPAGGSVGAALVTGGGGFAGHHLIEALGGRASSIAAPGSSELDLRDRAATMEAVAAAHPDVVFHLAAFSSPKLSWEEPARALLTNLELTLNLLEAVRVAAPEAVVVLVGSGQVYGAPAQLPVTEDAPLRPGNPYAVSKASCDLLGAQYAEAHGMRVVRLRPFNHAGPGQSDEYVLGSLARQVAEAEGKGASEVVLRTGNVAAARDFTDVRDIVKAYVLAAALEPGTYNVCSGTCVSVSELIEALESASSLAIRHEVDPDRLRPNDAPELRGSRERFTAATGWEPGIPLTDTVRDTLAWWRTRAG